MFLRLFTMSDPVNTHLHPVEKADVLESGFRKLAHN
jgi:hypothetical protein